MARIISAKVTHKRVDAKALINQLEGPERAYPVYRFSGAYKFERPEVAGRPYRWI